MMKPRGMFYLNALWTLRGRGRQNHGEIQLLGGHAMTALFVKEYSEDGPSLAR